MQVSRLDIRDFRRFDDVSLEPAAGLNLLIGDNGAGKSSVIEALHLMAYGRSFRGRVRDGLVRDGAGALEVFVEWREPQSVGERARRAGLRHAGSEWTGRLDGSAVSHLGELCAALAVITFEPGSHDLIHGSSEVRRRFMDWGLFHVEPSFLAPWRRYTRALKQRNALLKQRTQDRQLDAWDHELAEAGEQIGEQRRAYVDALGPLMAAAAADLAPMLGPASLRYLPGWRQDDMPLADALLLSRERDVTTGHTSQGPHRADWRLEFEAIPRREALSRGQAKLAALAALLAQAAMHRAATGQTPVFCLDDLASELDRHHQQRTLQRLVQMGSQLFVSGTDVPVAVREIALEHRMFHVEHGTVRPV